MAATWAVAARHPPFSQDWCHQAFKIDHNTPDCPTDNASMSLITGARRVLAPWIALKKRFRFRTTIGIGIVTVIILVFRAQEGIGRLVVLNLLRSPRLLAQLLLFDHKTPLPTIRISMVPDSPARAVPQRAQTTATSLIMTSCPCSSTVFSLPHAGHMRPCSTVP